MHRKVTIVVGHGSRLKESNDAFNAFVQKFSPRFPEMEFRVGYVELAEPRFKDVLLDAVSQAEEISVLPLFLLTAGHIKHDIRDLVSEVSHQNPQVKITLTSALGVHVNMVNLLSLRLNAAFTPLGRDPQKTACLMIGRGSSDTDANSDFCKIVRMVEEQVPFERMAYSFMAVVRPKAEEVLVRLIKEGHETILMCPYLLFNGQLMERMQALADQYSAKNPNLEIQVTEVLGDHDLILDLFEKRLHEGENKKEHVLSVV